MKYLQWIAFDKTKKQAGNDCSRLDEEIFAIIAKILKHRSIFSIQHKSISFNFELFWRLMLNLKESFEKESQAFKCDYIR